MSDKTIHILLVEDSETHAAMIREALDSGPKPVKLTLARSLAEARTSLAEFKPDLAFIDLLLPDGRGTELLPADQEEAAYPVVVITSHGDEQAAVEAMRAGALDYVVKSAATLADMTRILERTLREWNQITERRRAEEALKRSDEFSHTVLDSMNDCLSIIDVNDFRIVDVNRMFLEEFGFTKEEVIGETCYKISHALPYPCTAPDHVCPLLDTATTGQYSQVEHVHYGKEGEVKYVEVSTSPIKDKDGKVVQVVHVARDISERKRAELALRESEERFRSFFESSASGMAIITPEGKTLKVNPTFCRLSGYGEAEALNKNVFEVTHPEDREEARRLYDEIRAGRRKVVDYEKRYLRKDGSIVWGRATVAGVFGPNKDLLYYAANVQDITERKQAVNLLRESQQMLRLVLDNIPQYVFWKDRNSVYLGCNQNFARAAGIEKPEDIVGKTDYDLPWKKEESDFYRQCDKKTMETDTPEFHIIEGQLQADGKQAWVDTNKIPLHDSEGNVVGILGTYEDISQRKQAEEALRKSEASIQAIFNNVAAGIDVLDAEGRFVDVNDRLAEMLGYAKDELIGNSPIDFTHPEDRQESQIILNKALKGQLDAYSLEKRYVRKDGSIFWGDLAFTRVFDEKGEVEADIGIVFDVTERKVMEERLKTANRELEAFAYTVSHDLRTPLTPIIGYADFLRESYRERLDEQALECLAQISVSGNKMLMLMEDLLALAKVGHLERPAEAVDTDEVVQKVLENLGSRIASVGAAVQTASLPTLHVPETLLTQIFDNLIGNAIRYAGREGSPIEIGGERRGGLVLLHVRDHGPGIPEEERSQIFQVFYRGTTGKKSPGTGVGLATVQKIARLYEGRAWVEETPGGGSTFWVEILDLPTSGAKQEETP